MRRNKVDRAETNHVPFDPFDGFVDTRGALEELKTHWLPLFKRLDDGKSGKSYPAINIRHLKLHHRPNDSRISASILDKLFRAADADKDGVLEFREFVQWCMEEETGVPDREDEPDVDVREIAKFKRILDEKAGVAEEEMENQEDDAPFDPEDDRVDTKGLLMELENKWKPVFERLDDGRSGKSYPAVRLTDLRRHLRREETFIPTEVIDKLFLAADEDGDGVLEFKEFTKWCLEEEMGLPDRADEPDVSRKEISQFQKLLKSAVRPVVPRRRLGGYEEEEEEDYDDNYSCCPPPLFMLFISVAEIAVFIYYGNLMGKIGASTPVPVHSPLIYNPYRRYEAWRYLTYMFLHAGLVHLIFNLLIQLILGVPLELVHRWWRLSIIYFLGVIAGSLAHSLVDTETYLLGASGGVYAIIWAHLANIIINYKEMNFGKIRIAVLCVLTAMDVSYALYERFGKDEDSKVGVAAHIGGGLAGCLVGIFILKNIKRQLWEDRFWWVALSLYLLLMTFAIFWNAFATVFPQSDWIPLANITCKSDKTC